MDLTLEEVSQAFLFLTLQKGGHDLPKKLQDLELDQWEMLEHLLEDLMFKKLQVLTH